MAKVESTVTSARSVDIDSDIEVRRRPRTSTLALAGVIGPTWFTSCSPYAFVAADAKSTDVGVDAQ